MPSVKDLQGLPFLESSQLLSGATAVDRDAQVRAFSKKAAKTARMNREMPPVGARSKASELQRGQRGIAASRAVLEDLLQALQSVEEAENDSEMLPAKLLVLDLVSGVGDWAAAAVEIELNQSTNGCLHVLSVDFREWATALMNMRLSSIVEEKLQSHLGGHCVFMIS